jgi:hypothetical protein
VADATGDRAAVGGMDGTTVASGVGGAAAVPPHALSTSATPHIPTILRQPIVSSAQGTFYTKPTRSLAGLRARLNRASLEPAASSHHVAKYLWRGLSGLEQPGNLATVHDRDPVG